MSRPRRSEHTREALIQAGIEHLSRFGYHGTGIKQILDDVKVPKGSFYNFFASKETFVAELIQAYSQDLLLQLDDFIQNEGALLTPVDQLKAICRFSLKKYAQDHFQKSCLIGSLAAEISADSQLCRVELKTAMKKWLTFFSGVFFNAQQIGQVRNDLTSQQLASLYWTTWEGALISMKMNKRTEPAAHTMNQVLDVLFAPLCKPNVTN